MVKKRTKALPKSQRESKRYYLLDCADLELRKIKESFIFLYGALKFAESGFAIKPIDKRKVIKINSDYTNELIFSVYYCNKTQNLKIKIIKNAGTIESL